MKKEQYIKYYIKCYTKWTHDHFISWFTSANHDCEWKQELLQNSEEYSQFVVRSSMAIFDNVKHGVSDNNNGLSYNIEYVPTR